MQGKSKRTSTERPLVSIVTVVLNGSELLEKTILSVLNQTYDNIEYIVIDGGSEDNTIDIIKKYEDGIDFWVSAKDKGIYDAMNHGASVSTGDYINFMNAGDSFYTAQVLNDICHTFLLNKEIIVGAAEFVYTKTQRIIKPGRPNKFNMPNCHQALFYRGADFQNIYYCTDYSILADFKYWFDEYVLNSCEVLIIDDIICCYDMNGISSTLMAQALKEKIRIFNSASSWKYRVLGMLTCINTFFNIFIGKFLQK